MRRTVENCQGRGNDERGDVAAVPRSMSGPTVWPGGRASCAHCTSACSRCANLRPSSLLRQTLRPVSANLRVRSKPGPLCSDERDAPPVRGRPAGVGCPVSRRPGSRRACAGEPQRPRRRLRVLRVASNGNRRLRPTPVRRQMLHSVQCLRVRQARCTRRALTKAKSFLRLDKARVYLVGHQLIEHPVPARMHLRGKLSQMRGLIARTKTKSRDQVCRSCRDLISVRIEEWQSHREALDLPTSASGRLSSRRGGPRRRDSDDYDASAAI